MNDRKAKLETSSYKGVRDFYPEDMFVQNYIFKAMKDAALLFGYEEYNASILEPTDLYRAKTGEEIVNEQTYSFKDRGDRDVTLRPEMTPTLARMVAGKRRELSMPLRWFSIPNLFRYEKPQKGRLREHYQLNVDIFGISGPEAEIEIISVARQVLLNLRLKDEDFKVRISDRKLLSDYLYNKYDLDPPRALKLQKLIDKKDKIENFNEQAETILGTEFSLDTLAPDENLEKIITTLENQGVNIEFDPHLVRGFDYYTGPVFEIYDTSGENNRALFGGGRYDDLLEIFGEEKIPAVGFGMGDVTARDIMETYNLLPKYESKTKLYICPINKDVLGASGEIAMELRNYGIPVAVDWTLKKVGDQIKTADKKGVPYVMVIGQDEISRGKYSIKNLETGEETTGNIEEIVSILK